MSRSRVVAFRLPTELYERFNRVIKKSFSTEVKHLVEKKVELEEKRAAAYFKAHNKF